MNITVNKRQAEILRLVYNLREETEKQLEQALVEAYAWAESQPDGFADSAHDEQLRKLAWAAIQVLNASNAMKLANEAVSKGGDLRIQEFGFTNVDEMDDLDTEDCDA